MNSFERYPSWKITISRGYLPPTGGKWGLLVKQKLYIVWVFMFQSKILNFAIIGFLQISLKYIYKKFCPFLKCWKIRIVPEVFKVELSKNNRVITSKISIILNPERSFYNDLFVNVLIYLEVIRCDQKRKMERGGKHKKEKQHRWLKFWRHMYYSVIVMQPYYHILFNFPYKISHNFSFFENIHLKKN